MESMNKVNCKIVLESTEVTRGDFYIEKHSKITEINFKITDGIELIGLTPYNIKFNIR